MRAMITERWGQHVGLQQMLVTHGKLGYLAQQAAQLLSRMLVMIIIIIVVIM